MHLNFRAGYQFVLYLALWIGLAAAGATRLTRSDFMLRIGCIYFYQRGRFACSVSRLYNQVTLYSRCVPIYGKYRLLSNGHLRIFSFTFSVHWSASRVSNQAKQPRYTTFLRAIVSFLLILNLRNKLKLFCLEISALEI